MSATTVFAPPAVASEQPLEPDISDLAASAGRDDDARWVRPSLVVLLVATGVLYIWGLGASGWANSFYSAAVQAGTKSWKAFFFGSFDASNFITVDKPPASLWVMEISARIFGLNSWSILVPQALEGVAAVGFLYATVRRWFTPAAGLIAGAIMALTPVATLMFRFNNPDALLVLVLVIAAYAMTRALEDGRTRWLVIASVLVGLGFLTKMLQAFVVVPGFAFVYLVAGPPRLRRRFGQLLIAGATMFAAAGWWVAVVELVPASWRPYVGGSQNNSVLNLIFGYNGLGRVTGNETGSVGGRGNGTGMWGPTGWLRMFNTEFGGQTSWLIPAALILGIAGLVMTSRAARTDRTRAALMLWGSWLVVTAVLFSLSKGIIHPYYTVALAPAIGALVGVGAHVLWQRRSSTAARAVLAVTALVSAWWAVVLLDRSPNWHPWLRPVVVVAGALAAAAILAGPRLGKSVAVVGIAAATIAGLAGPAAYSIDTASSARTGAIPSAGPAVIGGRGFPGGRGGFPGFGVPGAGGPGFGGPGVAGGQPGTFPAGPGAGQTGIQPGFAGGGFPGAPGGNRAGGPGGGIGGLLDGSRPSAALVAVLDAGAGDYTWVLATVGANQAAGYQLATDAAVMAIGGFNGTDPTPTLAQFQAYVAAGRIHYFITGGTGGNSSASRAITEWVTAGFTSTTVGGTTLYDLTSAVG